MHCLSAHLIDPLVVGRVEDILLFRRQDHAELTEVIDEEAVGCQYRLHATHIPVLPQSLEVGRKDRVLFYGVFLTAEHDCGQSCLTLYDEYSD